MQVGRAVSGLTENNESFTVRDPEGSDECAGTPSSCSLTEADATPRGQLSALTGSFQIQTKGKVLMQQARLVEPAGAVEWQRGFDCPPRKS